MSGIQFKDYDLLEDRHIAMAVDELVDRYEGACSCPQWLMDLVNTAQKYREERGSY